LQPPVCDEMCRLKKEIEAAQQRIRCSALQASVCTRAFLFVRWRLYENILGFGFESSCRPC
jgi:hypothetical protein